MQVHGDVDITMWGSH